MPARDKKPRLSRATIARLISCGPMRSGGWGVSCGEYDGMDDIYPVSRTTARAAQAIAETMGRTLLMAWSGEGFMLSAVPIWVRPVAVALSVAAPA